jgi:hypothetical protein
LQLFFGLIRLRRKVARGEILSKVLGRRVEYVEIPEETMLEILCSTGMTPDQAEMGGTTGIAVATCHRDQNLSLERTDEEPNLGVEPDAGEFIALRKGLPASSPMGKKFPASCRCAISAASNKTAFRSSSVDAEEECPAMIVRAACMLSDLT